MAVSTTGAAVAITPVVIKVFAQHYARRLKERRKHEKNENARDDILFDEAFNIVKAFIAFACRNTVESLQAFTNTHIPSPYWFKVVPLKIPSPSSDRAADILTALLGPEGVRTLLGGSTWWRIRATEGVDAEWVAMKADVRGVPYGTAEAEKEEEEARKGSDPLQGKYVQGMDGLRRVMLYIHGGGFYWGSINTHRYQLGRFARKMKNGRVFAVNYRKAPHYPFPCALQDCIAAYLYLIDPPPGAPHKAVPPENIILAGDSAGGNLALSLLTVLRDAGLPMPAGTVLISPWVDLTHSFPSVMDNTATDILTPHGFIHQPSPLWPLPPQDSDSHVIVLQDEDIQVSDAHDESELDAKTSSPIVNAGKNLSRHARVRLSPYSAEAANLGEETDEGCTVELRSQIQLYATNEQLQHPLVSPLLHPSLGGLPPLYLLAGDGECLRDEVVYLAHRAAQPEKYRVENRTGYGDERWNETPTDVRLQVFDGMCHVLTVFTFIDSAHYAYRAVGEFARHLIPDETEASETATPDDADAIDDDPPPGDATEATSPGSRNVPTIQQTLSSSSDASEQKSTGAKFADKLDEKLEQARIGVNTTLGRTPTAVSPALTPPSESRREETTASGRPPTSSQSQSSTKRTATFVRQRISIRGVPRDLEPASSIPTLNLPASEIGIIKEGPVVRWLTGLQIYDKKYKRVARKALRTRARNTTKAELMLEHARSAGVLDGVMNEREVEGAKRAVDVLDLEGENVPPSAICGRFDVEESLVLLRTALVSRKQHRETLKANRLLPTRPPTNVAKAEGALDEVLDSTAQDGLDQPPAAEEQVQPKAFKASHGIRIWAGMMNYYQKRSKEKAKRATRPSHSRRSSRATVIPRNDGTTIQKRE